MKQQAAAPGERALVDGVRSVMAPGNPVPADAFSDDQPGWLRPLRADGGQHGRWRVIAPVLSGVAVVAVVVGLVLAGGAAPRKPPTNPVTPEGSGPPPYYVTINGSPPVVRAIVHSTRTGRTLATVDVPALRGETPTVAASRSGLTFYIAAAGKPSRSPATVTVLYRLSLSANGRSITLVNDNAFIYDPIALRNSTQVVTGISVAPDGRKLVAMMQVFGAGAFPRSELEWVPLHRGGDYAVFRAENDPAFGWDPLWVSNKDVAFLWQDQLKGTASDYTGRSAERLFNASGNNRGLLKSKVLATGGSLGLIQSAYAAPGGAPIIAASYRNVSASGGVGTATARLVLLSPATGKVISVIASQVRRYHDVAERAADDIYYRVLGLDASGRYTLVNAPRLGMVTHGVFTPLPAGPGQFDGAAW
jgi:hypothetical protein